MERKSSEKQEKLKYSDLPVSEQILYRKKSEYLIDRGYITNKSIDELANEIYETKWRRS